MIFDFYYYFETNTFYIADSDELDCNTEEYCYTVNKDDIIKGLTEILTDSASKKFEWNNAEQSLAKDAIDYVVGLVVQLFAEVDDLEYLVEEYYDALHEQFRDEAEKEWKQNR